MTRRDTQSTLEIDPTLAAVVFPGSPGTRDWGTNGLLVESGERLEALHTEFVTGHLKGTPGIPKDSCEQVGTIRHIEEVSSHYARAAEETHQSLVSRKLAGEDIPLAMLEETGRDAHDARQAEIAVLEMRAKINRGISHRGAPERINPGGKPLEHRLFMDSVAREGVDRIAGSTIVHYEPVFVGRVHRDIDPRRVGIPWHIVVTREEGSDERSIPSAHEYRIFFYDGENVVREACPKPDTTVVRTLSPEGSSDTVWFRSGIGGTYRMDIRIKQQEGALKLYDADGRNIDTGWLIPNPDYAARRAMKSQSERAAGTGRGVVKFAP